MAHTDALDEYSRQAFYSCGGLPQGNRAQHDLAVNAKNVHRQRTFLKEWRKFRHLTQEAASSRLGISQAQLSKIERGLHPYDQDFLEAAAEAYGCEPADLIVRNPLVNDAVWSITDNLKKATPAQQEQIKVIAEALLKAG